MRTRLSYRFAGEPTERQGAAQLVSTILLLLSLPWAEPHRYGRALVSVLFLVAALSGIAGMPGRSRRSALLAFALLGAAWMVTRTAGLVLPLGTADGVPLYSLIGLGLMLLMLGHIGAALTRAQQISPGVLARAFTGYLVLAIAFGQVYTVLGAIFPDAFNIRFAPPDALIGLSYFSLVTLASIGFGDIVPTHPFVRMVAALEGVCGLFYTAVVVARLVTTYNPRRSPGQGDPGIPGPEPTPGTERAARPFAHRASDRPR